MSRYNFIIFILCLILFGIDCFNPGSDVLWGNIIQHFVGRSHDISTIGPHDIHQPVNFLRYFCRRGFGQELLHVNPTPKNDTAAKSLLELGWLHIRG